MTIVNFLQKVRQALVPMCQATIDALLLGTLIIIILNYAGIGILFTYAASIYVLVYLIALVVWLRKTARDARVADGIEHSSDIGRVFYEGMGEPLQTPYPQNNSR